MKISEILSEDFIIANLEPKTKSGVLETLCRFLKEKGIIKDDITLQEALLEREKLGSTGIGENVAIPHAKSDDIDRIFCVFGKSDNGIEYESLDQKPVNFVCLLLAPSNSTGQHLKALARIARLLKSQNLREDILKAKDAAGIYSLILNEDSKFI
ncbi:MAG: PTS sugar transporter subunit IIA [Candidatus Nitronauta litoralis]|uniref:PTS sugar transporter subunit IIA n=1 Tax=Candidatus Nitronauta litoralis TaxID=2705533 RepID=A0A7T0G1G5_9BACT|nr:MAG: PTS sugar transporter subunit IIA [Candidatus Nitronauta litoralis]